MGKVRSRFGFPLQKSWMLCLAAFSTLVCPLQAESSIDQLVEIMILENAPGRDNDCPYHLFIFRDLNRSQCVYDLVTKHPELLQGILYNGQTFAMICANRGCWDVLERLFFEDFPLDFAKSCELFGPYEPHT
jgi:hypothetical protein